MYKPYIQFSNKNLSCTKVNNTKIIITTKPVTITKQKTVKKKTKTHTFQRCLIIF